MIKKDEEEVKETNKIKFSTKAQFIYQKEERVNRIVKF